MKWWQWLLFPFAIIYDCVTKIRNYLYDSGLWISTHLDSPKTVVVGNLSVGGTGKTPIVAYLLKMGMEEGWRMATLSRGYGRKTRGFKEVQSLDSAETVGDEPLGYFLDFAPSVRVFVGEDRVAALRQIKLKAPEVDLVVLDDGFQHRKLRADLYLVLTTGHAPFWKDHLLPAGRLRERQTGWKRADACIITKSIVPVPVPTVIALPVFRAGVRYGPIVPVNGKVTPEKPVHVVAGLADNSSFFQQVQQQFMVVREWSFRDHHRYTLNDLSSIAEAVRADNGWILTTFKDYVKINAFEDWQTIPWSYWPIEAFVWQGDNKLKTMLRKV